MITVKMITDRITEILAGQYPACVFYAHNVPASITRPAFNIYLYADRSEDSGLTTTGETLSVGITYFAPLTDPIADELKHFAVYSNIKDIFRKGSILVGDRSLKVTLLRGGRQDNEIYLIVKLLYSDDRPQYIDGVLQDGVTYDLMGEVKIDTNI